jgi:hypothetical protein
VPNANNFANQSGDCMTHKTNCQTLAIALLAVATVSAAYAQDASPITYANGIFQQGAHRLAVDDHGTLYLLAGDGPIVDGIVIAGVREGNSWQTDRSGGAQVHRGPEGITVTSQHGATGPHYTLSVTSEGESLLLRFERKGALPTEECEDFLRMTLPIVYYRGAQFYTERITLPYDDRTFEDPMMIDGFQEFRAHTTDETLAFSLQADEQIMRLIDPWQERLGSYRLEVPLPAGEEAAVELHLKFPPSSGSLLNPAIRFPAIGYTTNGQKRAIVEWHSNVEPPAKEVKVLSVDGSVAFEGELGEPTEFLGKQYAELDFSALNQRGVYRFSWAGGETDFFVVRETVIPDTLWIPTLERIIPWQMSHAEVDFGAALPPKRKAYMDDGVRAPGDVPSVGGFISHGQEGSLYGPGQLIPANIGGWFDGGVTHQSVTANAFTVWTLSLAHEQFGINHDTATYNQIEQKYSVTGSDEVPDIFTQIEWGTWWLLQMQEPTGLVYTGVASRPERDTVMIIPERTTDGEPGTDDERYVFVDYHPHVQLAQTIALSSAVPHLEKSNRVLARRALEAARAAFDYFSQQPEEYRPTVNFPYDTTHPVITAGRDGMVLAAAAELYIASTDPQYLEILEAMVPNIDNLAVETPAPRWSRESGLWYAAPSLARLHSYLSDGPLKTSIEGYLARAAKEKKAYLDQRPWPFSPQDIGVRGVNTVALAQVFDAYWISRVVPDELQVADSMPAFEWVVGMHPVGGKVFVTGIGFDAPEHHFNANIHGRVRSLKAATPGAVMPGVSRLPGNDLLVYADLPLKPQHHDARIADQALWLFAVHALKDAGF